MGDVIPFRKRSKLRKFIPLFIVIGIISCMWLFIYISIRTGVYQPNPEPITVIQSKL
ncbi:MAG: hypothetical protein ACE3JP_04950 [Ectobacillus sp.]